MEGVNSICKAGGTHYDPPPSSGRFRTEAQYIHLKHTRRHGLSQKETENQDQQAQAQETHAG